MRLLSERAILESVDSLSPSELETAERLIPVPDALTGRDSRWLALAVNARRIFVSRMIVDGFCTGLFFWHQSYPATLVINGVISHTNEDQHLTIEYCALQLARERQCTEIEFQTRRPGLVKQAKRHGYIATAIVLKKMVPSP